ncbi:MAG: hypothetical protein ACI89X_000434 [Planctomycetota bacterium]|jgi:hypothetical protein
MTNNDPQFERISTPTAASKAAYADTLARYKRASLRDQALRAVWRLEALLRRVKREAPEVHRRLRVAAEALQLLSAKLTIGSAGELPLPTMAGPRSVARRTDGSRALPNRENEFF